MRDDSYNKKNGQLLVWGIYLSVGLIVALTCATIWDLFSQTEPLQIVRILADSFFMPGVFFLGFSLLGWMSRLGAYDIFGYSINGLFSMWKKESYFKATSYYDYKQKKDAERKPANKQMLYVGLIYAALGVIFTVVYLIME